MAAPDPIGRDFTANAVNQHWCGDITFIKTWEGWAYLATVIDLHSRAVVDWAIADHLRTNLTADALDMALAHRAPPAGVIFHSDRGRQDTSSDLARYCTTNSFEPKIVANRQNAWRSGRDGDLPGRQRSHDRGDVRAPGRGGRTGRSIRLEFHRSMADL